jgi:ABC-2 type transport system ATP-binding protein
MLGMFTVDIKNLSKQYNDGNQALKNVNIKISQGEFLGLLGRNGAGKTTLIEILSSLTQKSSGKIIINGVDLEQNRELAKSYIGVVPQEFNLSIFEKVLQILINQAGYFGINKKKAKEKALHLLEQLGLLGKKDSTVSSLSGGMKRRLMIARALIHDPQIIFFDEPTAGVDVEVRRKIWNIMKSLNEDGKTIILTSHYFEEVENLCNTIAILGEGKIIKYGKTTELLSQANTQSYLIEGIGITLDMLKNFSPQLISKDKIEIMIDTTNTLSDALQILINQNINIKNVYMKGNKLEEFFLNA